MGHVSINLWYGLKVHVGMLGCSGSKLTLLKRVISDYDVFKGFFGSPSAKIEERPPTSKHLGGYELDHYPSSFVDQKMSEKRREF